MDDFEERLRKALGRQLPSRDFTARVLTRAAQCGSEGKPGIWSRIPYWRWAIAVVLSIAIAGTFAYRQMQQQHERGEAARRQVVVALQIASEKLQLAQYRVQHLSDR